MEKLLFNLVTVVSLVFVFGLYNTASASISANVPIGAGTTGRLLEKYYANGLYCNQFTCRVNWNQAWNSIGRISVNGWVEHGPWAHR